MKTVVVALLLITAAAAAEFWTLRRRAEQLCYAAQELGSHATAASRWLKEAGESPYLGEAALKGAPLKTLSIFRETARRVSGDFSAHLLPDLPIGAFREFGKTEGDGSAVIRALDALVSAGVELDCGRDKPSSGEFDALVAEADHTWALRKSAAEASKAEFGNDRQIFCHSEGLIARLRSVVEAAAKKCQLAPRKSKLARGCAEERTSGVQGEIDDLERQQELNLHKLREKWPESVIEGLAC